MIANILIALVAALHLYFMYLEMVAWDTPAGRKAFSLTPEFATASKALAANQGLYNGFLAAGLIWGIYLGDAGFQVKAFFLICVIVAGLFGGADGQPQDLVRAGAAGDRGARRAGLPGADGQGRLAWREPCG